MSRTVVSSTASRAGGFFSAPGGGGKPRRDKRAPLLDDKNATSEFGTSFYSHSLRSPSGDRCSVSYPSVAVESMNNRASARILLTGGNGSPVTPRGDTS